MIEAIWDFLGRNSAEVIALCAMAFTAYQAVLTRRHNVLSVHPHLTTFVNRHKGAGQGGLAFRLMNNGVGPAFISSFRILLDDEPVEDFDAAVTGVLGAKRTQHTITTLGDGYVMPAGEVRDLLVVTFPLDEGESVEDVEAKLYRFDLVVSYAFAYEQKQTLDTREKSKSANKALQPSASGGG